MLLRIIDVPASNGSDDSIRILLQDPGNCDDLVATVSCISSTTEVSRLLADYFATESLVKEPAYGNPSAIDKLIRWGQNTGETFFKDDSQLVQVKEYIEARGYQKLRVQIESERAEFFMQPWEALVLHESNYVLSAVVSGYARRFEQSALTDSYPDLNFGLKVNSSAVDDVSMMLQPESANTLAKGESAPSPLHILYLLSRSDEATASATGSYSLNCYLDAKSEGGNVEYEIIQSTNWQRLEDRLLDRNNPIHALHYDGPIAFDSDRPNILLNDFDGSETLIDFDQLCKAMVANEIPLLSIEGGEYINSSKVISPAQGLASIALSAQQQGLGNVIGLSHVTNSPTSSRCFHTLYSQLTLGLTLEQAVVEARKVLQATHESSLTTIKPVTFHAWPLLVHYAKQSVIYFEKTQADTGPIAPAELELLHQQLYGFRSSMLPPLLDHIGDRMAMRLLDRVSVADLNDCNRVMSIVGEAGVGKTHLTHVVSAYFALTGRVSHGFYFDFRSVDYSYDDILDMIAPVLEIDVAEKQKVQQKLSKMRCCFVFDDIFSGKSNAEIASSGTGQELLRFIDELVAQGHIVLTTGDVDFVGCEATSFEVDVSPLSPVAQRMIAINSVRHLNLAETTIAQIDQSEELEGLLAKVDGNPWLIRKLMPQLVTYNLAELGVEIDRRLTNSELGSKVDSFYRWQWSELNPGWQTLLILCSEVQGLLLETLLMPFGAVDSFQPARDLLLEIGCEDIDYPELLNKWERSGFISRLPHGRVIDEKFLKFLQREGESSARLDDESGSELYFSQVVCEGVRRLILHVLQQPNQSISNNLLLNRRSWAERLETLWFKGDYLGFMATKNALDQLLKQANLVDESTAWVFDLLERTTVPDSTNESSLEAKLSWLTLATLSVGTQGATDSKHIQHGIEVWQTWLNELADINKAELSIFHHAVTFLESFYLLESRWRDCIVILERAYAVYLENEAWQKVIHTLTSLAHCHSELGEQSQALIYEDKVIYEIPYSDAPPGFQAEKILNVLMKRLSRKDMQNAQIVLDELKATSEAEKLADVLDGIQCEIHLRQQNYLAALPYCCKKWAHAIQSNQHSHIDQLKTELMELKNKLGSSDFDECFERVVPDGIVRPENHTSSLH